MREESGNLNLLVIEDNSVDLFLLKEMLNNSGLVISNIYETDRLEQAFDLLKKKEVHLALLDLSLPDSSGIESFLLLRESSNRIPIIILTGLSDTDIALQAIQAGAKDYLVKGEFNGSILSRTIQYTLEKRKLEKDLEAQQKIRQQQITAAALVAQENERRYIGEELHDNINQILTSVKLYISTALDQPHPMKEILEKALGQTTLAIEEIRNLSRKLVSPGIKTGSLSQLLQRMLNDIKLVPGTRVDFNVGFDEKLLKEELKIAVYRIIQEQISNILRHAQATMVNIDLSVDDGQLLILTTDNGLGFNLSTSRQGIGITNMISRAEMFNGAVEIDTFPGKGCIIKIKLPLTADK